MQGNSSSSAIRSPLPRCGRSCVMPRWTRHRVAPAQAQRVFRNVLMHLGQRAASVKFLIRDRAGQFTSSFDAVFTAEGIRVLRSPPQAPRANAICERMIGTLRRELLDQLLIVNKHHLRRALTEYLQHYNAARPHRALGQLTPAQASTRPPEPIDLADHRICRICRICWICRKQVLSGLTHEYYIAALPPHAATERCRSSTRIVFSSPTGWITNLQPLSGLLIRQVHRKYMKGVPEVHARCMTAAVRQQRADPPVAVPRPTASPHRAAQV